MKITKILAFMMAVIMITALAGCGSDKRTPIKLTLSTEDAEAIMAAAGIMLPDAETVSGAGKVAKWYSNWDFHNYSEDEVVNTGFFTFTEKYSCEIEWIEYTWEERYTYLANLVLSGASPDFTPAAAELFPMKAIKGVIAPVNDYVDYANPLWADMKEYAEKYFSIGDRIYFILTDMTFDLVCPYNRRVMRECGFDDPAELYANDEWTWDVFKEMCLDFTDSDADRYALDGWYFSLAFMHSSGVPTVGYDTTSGIFVSNIDDPRLERAAQVLYDLNKAEVIYPYWNNNWSIRNSIDGGGMKNGYCLFQPISDWAFTGPVEDISAVWGDVRENELMFVPMPRDPNGDGVYYQDIKSTGFALVTGGTNHDTAVLLAMCDRFKILDPTVVGIDRYQKEHTYLWTEEMLDMYDECYRLANSGVDNVILTYGVDSEAGYGSAIGSRILQFDNIARSTTAAGSKSWAQLKESLGGSLQAEIDELNRLVAEFKVNGFSASPSLENN